MSTMTQAPPPLDRDGRPLSVGHEVTIDCDSLFRGWVACLNPFTLERVTSAHVTGTVTTIVPGRCRRIPVISFTLTPGAPVCEATYPDGGTRQPCPSEADYLVTLPDGSIRKECSGHAGDSVVRHPEVTLTALRDDMIGHPAQDPQRFIDGVLAIRGGGPEPEYRPVTLDRIQAFHDAARAESARLAAIHDARVLTERQRSGKSVRW